MDDLYMARLWKLIGWIGTGTSIVGSFLVASGAMFPGYCFFIVGAVSWLLVAAVTRNASLFVLNAFFFIANAIGLVRNY